MSVVSIISMYQTYGIHMLQHRNDDFFERLALLRSYEVGFLTRWPVA